MNVIPEAERIDARRLPSRFREECSCCSGKGSHILNCWVLSNEGQICNECDGRGVVPTKEGLELLAFLRVVTR